MPGSHGLADTDILVIARWGCVLVRGDLAPDRAWTVQSRSSWRALDGSLDAWMFTRADG